MRDSPISKITKWREAPAGLAAGTALLFVLAGCQAFEPPGGPVVAEVDAPSPVAALQRINERGLQCWFRSGEREFRNYAMVPELDTRTGQPRILIVRRGNQQGLPELVITAGGDPVRITTFGPLAGERLSARINADILAWSAGRPTCS
ncbi:MAG: hypothetical protein ABL307_06150 [Roseitalea porphyridii]|uniref:hypothetical protein n=1 Tax=Roseitalea porphyridii TaxID=1852022 RepID=UPI0032D91AD0